jgi:type VI secretion system protein VasD
MYTTTIRPTADTVLLKLCALLAALIVQSACGLLPGKAPKTPAAQDYQFSVSLTAPPDSNPDARSQPSPVRVRIFLLEPDSDLVTQPFERVFDFDGSGAPPKPNTILVLNPGTTQSVTVSGKKNQTKLVIAAAFRDIHSAKWIETKSIIPSNPGIITATVNAASVEIQ